MVLGYCSELYGIERDIENEPNKRSRRSSRRDRDRRPGRMALTPKRVIACISYLTYVQSGRIRRGPRRAAVPLSIGGAIDIATKTASSRSIPYRPIGVRSLKRGACTIAAQLTILI